MHKEMSYLEKKIIKVINKFDYANYRGLSSIIESHKPETIRRKTKELVDKGIIISQTEKDNSKILSLSEEGKEIAVKLENELLIRTKPKVAINKLDFYNFLSKKVDFVEGEKRNNILGFDSKDIDLLGVDLETNLYVLFMQRKSGSKGIEELFDRIMRTVEKEEMKKVQYMYIQIFDKEFKRSLEGFIEEYLQNEDIVVGIFEV